MAQLSENFPFDYSPRGGTVDELGYSYINEIKRLYSLINDLRENKEGTAEPQPNQIMISDGGKVYIRATNNMNWVYIGEVKENLGLNELGFVKKDDIGLDAQGNINANASKLTNAPIIADNLVNGQALVYDAANLKWTNKSVALINEQGIIQGSVTGGANSIANYPIVTENIQDGEILVYRPSKGGFVNETKASGVGAKEISFLVDGVSLGGYSGTTTTNITLLSTSETEPLGTEASKPPIWLKPIE